MCAGIVVKFPSSQAKEIAAACGYSAGYSAQLPMAMFLPPREAHGVVKFPRGREEAI